MNNLSSEGQELVNEYKKSGKFDQLRLAIYKSFEESSECDELRAAVEKIVLKEFEDNPQLLQMETYKAIAILDQAIVRNKTDIYKDAKAFISERTTSNDFQAEVCAVLDKSSAKPADTHGAELNGTS